MPDDNEGKVIERDVYQRSVVYENEGGGQTEIPITPTEAEVLRQKQERERQGQ